MAYVTIPTQSSAPEDVKFSSSGEKMYEATGGYIYEYILSIPWDLSTAVYNSVNITTQEWACRGIAFSSDGYILYEVDSTNAKIYEYILSVAWDLSTAVYSNVNIGTQTPSPQSVAFSLNGEKMYEGGQNAGGHIYEYDLSTAWDISSAVYNSVTISGQDYYSSGIAFSSDGYKMYETGSSDDKIHEYALGTAWDLSTAVYNSVNIDTRDGYPAGITFSPNGGKMYETGKDADLIYQSYLGTLWDISTATDVVMIRATANVVVTATAVPPIPPQAAPTIAVIATAEATQPMLGAAANISVTATAEVSHLPRATANIVVTATTEPYAVLPEMALFTFAYSIQRSQEEAPFRFVYRIEQPQASIIIERVNS